MVARVSTVAFESTNVLDIDMQMHMSSGLLKFSMVGLADNVVTACAPPFALGLPLPVKHIARRQSRPH